MQVLVNSNNSVEVSEGLQQYVIATVEDGLQRFEDQLTRVEVHLSDENSDKSGPQDKRCQLEARVKTFDPISVSHKADEVQQALDGAVDKMGNALDTIIGKLNKI